MSALNSKPVVRLHRREIRQTLEADGLHPLLARLMAMRNVHDARELDFGLSRLPDFRLLRDIDKATKFLHQALQQQKKILVVGDFDADGATSTALALRALRAMGAQQIDYLVPNRFDFGYGLTPELVQYAARNLTPDLIITVDNGIASISGVAEANKLGIEVLVTDHHLPGESLPAALAIVNPNQPRDDFPVKTLAGVGVMFYLLIALRQYLREKNWFASRDITEPSLADWLDLVALGTVADVVPLEETNRILVEQGLRRMRAGKCSLGILALLQQAGIDHRRVIARDLGFAVGPRLNAAGRLEDMSLGIECLLTDDHLRAAEMAHELDSLNRARRAIEDDMREQAFAHIEETFTEAENDPVGICLYHPDWHQGVIGLVAARVKERLHRPVIAFAAADEKMLKGSARSIPGLHIRDALAMVDSLHPGLIEKFGGHAMAAGLSLPAANLETFAEAFDAAVIRLMEPGALEPKLLTDGELAADEYSLEVASLLRHAAPWGQGFPEPLFDGVFIIRQKRVLKERHLKLMLAPEKDLARAYDAIQFNADLEAWPEEGEAVHIAFRLEENHYQGRVSLQLAIVQPFS